MSRPAPRRGPPVPKRQLSIEVVDDGSTVTLLVHRWELVGGVLVGPHHVADRQTLSFPGDDVEQWHRDMVVMVLELL